MILLSTDYGPLLTFALINMFTYGTAQFIRFSYYHDRTCFAE